MFNRTDNSNVEKFDTFVTDAKSIRARANFFHVSLIFISEA
jgi:hypothetical protein